MGESEARPQTVERLRWLLEGDPLALRRAAALRLRSRALFLDGDLLYLRTLVRSVLEPLHPSEKGAEACVDFAMEEILREMLDSLTAASLAGGVIRRAVFLKTHPGPRASASQRRAGACVGEGQGGDGARIR